MKYKSILLVAVFCILSAKSIFAQENQEYIVKLKPTAALAIEYEDGYVLDQLDYAPQYCRVENMEEIENYIGLENVESIEPRRTLELFDMPNDPYYDDQWAYTEMHTEYARLAGITGKDVKVAVIDSGIYAYHEEFADVDIAAGRNFARVSKTDHTVNADDLTDYIGHGTAVTSVIAANTDNELGGCGIAPGVTIIPMRCFSPTEGYDDWAAEAIYAAVNEYDCDIINMSFGEQRYSTVFYEAIQYAHEQGVIMVAAAANYGSTTKYYPAAFDEVIGVGSVGKEKVWSDFSQHNDSVFITAPGEMMVTAEKTAPDAYRVNRRGTSFSSPCIAALAALVHQVDHNMTPAEFCQLLEETAEDLGEEGYDEYYGNGFVEVEAVLKALNIDLEPVTAKGADDNTEVSGFIEGFQPQEKKRLVIAGYQENGKMLSVVVPEKYQADKIGVLDIREKFLKEIGLFEKVKLFWLDIDGEFPVPEDLPVEILVE